MSVHSTIHSRDGMDKYQKGAIPTHGKPENITPKWGGALRTKCCYTMPLGGDNVLRPRSWLPGRGRRVCPGKRALRKVGEE